MADLCAEREPGFDIGFLSKQREEWVLVTQAREGTKLRGYSFCTLERIGGTPSLLVGLASIDRTTRAESALKAMMADQYRRALLAFPDEDVLLGTRLLSPDGFRAFAGLTDVVPRPGHKPERRGAGLGPPAGQALRGRGPPRRPHLRGEGRRLGRPAASTSWPPRPRCPTGSTSCSPGWTPRPGRPAGGLRLGDGRGPGRGQARPLTRAGRDLSRSAPGQDRRADLVAVAVAGLGERRQQVLGAEPERGGQGLAREPVPPGGVEGPGGVAVLDRQPDVVSRPSRSGPRSSRSRGGG